MIEGLKLDFTAEELEKHLTERISNHNERTEFYSRQADSLEAGRAEAQQYTNGDPIRSLRESESQHRNRMVLLTVLRDHLVSGETYRLDEGDLSKLEYYHGRMW
jgi:hypothetical protein